MVQSLVDGVDGFVVVVVVLFVVVVVVVVIFVVVVVVVVVVVDDDDVVVVFRDTFGSTLDCPQFHRVFCLDYSIKSDLYLQFLD